MEDMQHKKSIHFFNDREGASLLAKNYPNNRAIPTQGVLKTVIRQCELHADWEDE